MKIPIFQIKVNDEQREVDQEAVHGLATSIFEVGLMNPITVDQDYTLIAGLQRLEAAKLLGWTEIECTVSDLEGLAAELAKVDENVARKGLSAVDLSELFLRRKKIYEELHPETRRGGDRKSEKIKLRPAQFDFNKSFLADTSEKTGMAQRTIAENIQMAKDLTDEAKEIIRNAGSKITKKEALAVSRLEPEQQKEAASQLASRKATSADEVQPPPAPPPDPEKNAHDATTVPYSFSGGHYASFKESVADLKNHDKDCSYTPDALLAEMDSFIQKFQREFAWYSDPFCAVVFPHISPVQLEYLQKRFDTISAAIRDLLKQIKRSMKK